jgi:NADPH2:quinone reductase
VLALKGSLYLSRPSLFNYTAARRVVEQAAGELFEMVSNGKVKVEVKQRFPLADAAEAHRTLEARKTSGSTVFTI